MPTKYPAQFLKRVANYANTHTKKQLCHHFNLTPHQFECLSSRHHIRAIDYNPNKAHPHNTLPPYSEYVKPDGMTLIKTPEGEWKYKQRYIYEQHYPLHDDEMVVFLDQDRSNFSLDNLRAVKPTIYNIAKNKGLISTDKNVTNAALDMAELLRLIERRK